MGVDLGDCEGQIGQIGMSLNDNVVGILSLKPCDTSIEALRTRFFRQKWICAAQLVGIGHAGIMQTKLVFINLHRSLKWHTNLPRHVTPEKGRKKDSV